MRDPNRINIFLDILSATWKKYPYMRLGQLIENTRSLLAQGGKTELFYLEDDELQKGLEKMYDLMEKQTK